MKNLKNLLPLLAIVLGISLVFTQSAFKSSNKSTTTLAYQYQDSDDYRINDVDAWEPFTEESQSCGEGQVLPCVVQFETTDYADLQAYLNAHQSVAAIEADEEYLIAKKAGVINP